MVLSKDFFNHLTKVVLIILGLTLLFIIDDLLLLLLVGELRIWYFTNWVYLIVSLFILLINVSLAWVVYRALKKKPMTGAEGMIDKTGVALEDFQKSGKVLVNGEIWQAKATEKIKKNEIVRVIALSGLTVSVAKMIEPKSSN